MAEPISISNDDAEVLLQVIFDQLQKLNAIDVMHGIEESRRSGIQEDLSKDVAGRRSERVGTIRRRPATNIELLGIAFEELRQRLFVFPSIVDALERRLGNNQILWRVDREFVSQDLINTVQADLVELHFPEADQILPSYEKLRELIPDLVPPVKSEVV
jgi:hypothetical protein